MPKEEAPATTVPVAEESKVTSEVTKTTTSTSPAAAEAEEAPTQQKEKETTKDVSGQPKTEEEPAAKS